MNILLKRFIASVIDFGIIAVYAILLLLGTIFISSVFDWKLNPNPYFGQLIGFITLTLPVIMYSYLTEKSKWKGTVGKKLQKLSVVTDHNKLAKNILIRNILKYLPWVFAHTGVHWTIYYIANDIETPLWTWIFLIIPQLVVIAYLISIINSKGQKSIYDNVAKTKIVYQTSYEQQNHSR